MKVYNFNKEKYGIPLLMDLGIIENTPLFAFSNEVHSTDFFEIMIFSEANGHIIIDTEKVELSRGVFLFISPFQKRRWFVDNKKVKGYYLIFEKDFLNDFFSDKLFVYRMQFFYNPKLKPYFIPNKDRLFSHHHDIFEEILYEIKHFQEDSPHLLRSIMYYMLIKMNREYCEFHNLESNTQLNNLAFQFKVLIEHKIKSLQNVNDYSEELGVSRISLNDAVKKQFGITASEMIKERLLYEVKTELLYSTKSIAEIAYTLNFSEPNNMIRFFKSKMGESPNKFRKTYQIDLV